MSNYIFQRDRRARKISNMLEKSTFTVMTEVRNAMRVWLDTIPLLGDFNARIET